jgi:predicted ArsR family transcriptional regulator
MRETLKRYDLYGASMSRKLAAIALDEQGEATATMVARETGMSDSSARAALSDLVEYGVAERAGSKDDPIGSGGRPPKQYRMVD